MAVFAPLPSASAATAAAVNPGLRRSMRLIGLTRWVRLRLRAALWRHWKTQRRRRAALLELGVLPRLASNTAGSARGPWYLARAKALSVGRRVIAAPMPIKSPSHQQAPKERLIQDPDSAPDVGPHESGVAPGPARVVRNVVFGQVPLRQRRPEAGWSTYRGHAENSMFIEFDLHSVKEPEGLEADTQCE